jgi:hypothetical protein
LKSRNDEMTQRVLMLLKIDANNVFRRIKDRKIEYLEIFALRRTREHFPMIFDNRYEQTSLENLIHCSTELITTLDQFYTPVEEMRWYLFQTEDMPNTVEDYIDRKIRRMEKLLATLNLYLDAELGIQSETSSDVIPSEHQELSLADDFAINFQDDTPQE